MRSLLVSAAILAAGCSPGLRTFTDVDDRVQSLLQVSGRGGGLIDAESSASYGVVGGGVIIGGETPSESFAGEEDDWSGLGFSGEGGYMLQLLGDDHAKLWAGVGLQAMVLRMVGHKAGSDDGHDHTDGDSHDVRLRWGGGPIVRIGFGWIEETKSPTAPQKRMAGPELGFSYVVLPDFGTGWMIELSWFNISF